MSEKMLQVQMLGGFSMHYGNEAVIMNKIGNSKSVRLLQMLFLSLDGGIAKTELIDNLYGWDEKADAANGNRNLNNLIYRLKGQMVSCGLPDDDYVEISEGRCQFKSSITLELDTDRFEKLIKQARNSEGEERIILLVKANEMYFGELLPANQSDMWFFQKSNYYKELYKWTIEELEQYYLQTRDYMNRLQLYARAVAIYPYENWQINLIQCNLEMYRYEEAVNIYNETMELYARELGNPPIAEMQACFEGLELIDDIHKNDAGKLISWKNMDNSFSKRKNDIKMAIFGSGGEWRLLLYISQFRGLLPSGGQSKEAE